MKVLRRIIWCCEIGILEPKTIFESKGIQVFHSHIGSKIPYPEINIGCNIRPHGNLLIVLEKKLAQNRRIIISFVG